MTTYIQKAIEKSIEGGYKTNPITTAEKEQGFQHNVSEIFLDSLFWQGLGKALGWEKLSCYDCWSFQSASFPHHETDECITCSADRGRSEELSYMVAWHRFIDHLTSGKPAEEFFKDLLE